MSALPLPKKERYTYADYLTWSDDERWELIDGTPYNMSPAPSRQHQKVMLALARQIADFLDDKTCEVYVAPFDVRLPEGEQSDENILTVVQPDIVVVCDLEKLDDRGCVGAPDLIIEVLSPGSTKHDLIKKSKLYERHSVKEYWTIHPIEQYIYVQILDQDGSFGERNFYEATGEREVSVLPGLHIDFNRVFGAPKEE